MSSPSSPKQSPSDPIYSIHVPCLLQAEGQSFSPIKKEEDGEYAEFVEEFTSFQRWREQLKAEEVGFRTPPSQTSPCHTFLSPVHHP